MSKNKTKMTFQQWTNLAFSNPEDFIKIHKEESSNKEELPEIFDRLISTISSNPEPYLETDSEAEMENKFHRNFIRGEFLMSLGITRKRIIKGKRNTIIIG